jgi:hypothetical protein
VVHLGFVSKLVLGRVMKKQGICMHVHKGRRKLKRGADLGPAAGSSTVTMSSSRSKHYSKLSRWKHSGQDKRTEGS